MTQRTITFKARCVVNMKLTTKDIEDTEKASMVMVSISRAVVIICIKNASYG